MSKTKQVILTTFSIILVVIFLFPFYWMIITSIKIPSEILTSPPVFIPQNPTFEAFYDVLTDGEMARNITNSLMIALPAVVITISLGVLAAYGLARFHFRGLKVFLLILLAAQLLPDISMVLPLFVIFGELGLLDNHISPALANVTMQLPFVILILRPYFLKIPKTLEEAARIDGCSFMAAFLRIIVPLGLPGIITASILTFLFAWGEFVFALTFLSRNEMQPVTIGIYNAIGQYGIRYNLLMASATIAIIPVIFIFFQKYIRGGLVVGGVKE